MNSHLPVGRLATCLEFLPKTYARQGILAAMVALAIIDGLFPDWEFGPLYIPILCMACWTLGARSGFLVALLTALLAVALHLTDEAPHASGVLIIRALVQIATNIFIAAIVISFRRSFDRERFLALRDRMTGALNKEAFHEQATAMLDAASQIGETLVLAILDLDDFKAVNNKHGHAAGDTLLRVFAQSAKAHVRRQDLFGRIGGDEFAFLIRVHSIEEGHNLATALHTRLSAVLMDAPHPVTCSMGALLIPVGALRTENELMHSADQAMYMVKHSGKNAVEIARADIPPVAAEPPRPQPANRGDEKDRCPAPMRNPADEKSARLVR